MIDRDRLEAIAASYGERELTIGGTTFVIGKLLPMDAFRVLEKIRVAIGHSVKTINTEGMEPATSIVALLFSLPEDTVEDVRKRLFAGVKFRNQNAVTPRPVYPDEAMAFRDLEPVAVYEVLVRCLAVNFTGSFREIISRMGALIPDSPPPDIET